MRARQDNSNPADRLPNEARRKLTLLAARLGSDFEGERAAAALLGARLLEGFGLRWDDVVSAPVIPPPPGAREPRERKPRESRRRDRPAWVEPTSWGEGMERCAEVLALFDRWEVDFILQMRTLPATAWTPKRVKVAERLVAKARAYALGGGA